MPCLASSYPVYRDISKPAWDKLDAKDQELIKKLAREAQMEQRELWDQFVADAIAKLKEKDVDTSKNLPFGSLSP